jgi:hypothetical protein
MELKETLEATKDRQYMKCEECTETAEKICLECIKLSCEKCTKIHGNHEVIRMDMIRSSTQQVVEEPSGKMMTLYCSLHRGKELELYCETCDKLICLNCTVNKHSWHEYDLVENIFRRHKAEVTASLEPVREQMGVVKKELHQYLLRSCELDDLQVAITRNIEEQIQRLQGLLKVRKAELIDQLWQLIQTEKKNLEAQKDEVETVMIMQDSCLEFVTEGLMTGPFRSREEVMKMKRGFVERINELTGNFRPDMLPPRETSNIRFIPSLEIIATGACQHFGRVYIQRPPEKSSGLTQSCIPGKLRYYAGKEAFMMAHNGPVL